MNGDIISSTGDVRGILNVTSRGVRGRNIFLFVVNDRMGLRRAVAALTPNITLERDLLIRARDRKPGLIQAAISIADNRTLDWQFAKR